MSTPQTIKYGIAILFGAAIATAITLQLIPTKQKSKIVSPASCFLDESTSFNPIGQIDNILIHTENIPPDLYLSMLRIESDAKQRKDEITRQIAVRAASRQQQTASQELTELPELNTLLETAITDEDVKEYFNQNTNAFPGVEFEKVSNLIRKVLEKREIDLLLASKQDELTKENRLNYLSPIPCGGKIKIPYGNNLPGRGKPGANFRLLYSFSLDCSQCRADVDRFTKFIEQNMHKMRLWMMPHPGAKDSKNEHFAAAFHCAFQDRPENIMAFYKKALYSPLISDNQVNVQSEVEKLAINAGANPEQLKQCMTAAETKKTVDEHRQFLTKFGVNHQQPQYFLNERGMNPDIGLGLIDTLKIVMNESQRLEKVLK